MKKPALNILVLVTCIFAAFVTGFFAGRNLNRVPVRIYQATAQVTEAASEAVSESFSEAISEAVSEPDAADNTAPTAPVLVNINTADAAQLETLPGIGPVLAQRIIEYREENGDFRSPEELTAIKGIGEKRLLQILDLITVGG